MVVMVTLGYLWVYSVQRKVYDLRVDLCSGVSYALPRDLHAGEVLPRCRHVFTAKISSSFAAHVCIRLDAPITESDSRAYLSSASVS